MNFQVKLHLQRFARKLRAKRNIYELLLPTDDITKNLLCFQIIVGCRGVKSDLFVVSPSTHTYGIAATFETEGNERGVKIIPTFLR